MKSKVGLRYGWSTGPKGSRSCLAIAGARTRQNYGGFPKEPAWLLSWFGAARFTGSESGRLGVNAAVAVAEQGNLAHPLGGDHTSSIWLRRQSCRS